MNMPSRDGTVSRRSVIGAAWAAPVIVAAVAAPLAAASSTGVASEIRILNDPEPITASVGDTAFILLTVLDASSKGVAGLVSATLLSDTVGRFDVGHDDYAVTETLARGVADNGGFIAFSLIGVAAGSVAVVLSSGSISRSVAVTFS